MTTFDVFLQVLNETIIKISKQKKKKQHHIFVKLKVYLLIYSPYNL